MPKEITGRGWSFPPQINAQGRMALTSELSEIDQAMIIILSTGIGERVMRPTFGSRLQELLFEPLNGRTLSMAEEYTRDALGMWEPRIDVQDVQAQADMAGDGRIIIDIEYEVKNNNDRRSLVYPFYVIPEEE